MFAVRPDLSSKREQTMANLANEKLAGFYTHQIRAGGVRKSFRLSGWIGDTAVSRTS